MKNYISNMAKIILCIALAGIMMISLASCKNEPEITETEPPETWVRATADVRPVEFDKLLLDDATDVVIGECKDVTFSKGYYYYTFDITESLRGKGLSGELTLSAVYTDYAMIDLDENADSYRFSTEDIKYSKGKSYLLILERRDSVYNKAEKFSLKSMSLVLPIDALNDPARSDELRLYNRKLRDYIKNEETLKALDNGELIQRVLELVKDNPLSTGSEYMKETDMPTVIEKSDYVFKVTIKNESIVAASRVTYKCTVNEVMKGKYSKEIATIIFPSDTVKLNETYIVALYKEKDSLSSFTWSSKASLYQVSEYDAIMELIKES